MASVDDADGTDGAVVLDDGIIILQALILFLRTVMAQTAYPVVELTRQAVEGLVLRPTHRVVQNANACHAMRIFRNDKA
ncbi:hypothetical protein EDC54_103223 [Samsonia erythrinae]|uniref:Uncharacterized protein n=1 Tax=Samsonia erythrinae TaxID=160434 RepID=A0A4V2VTI3_9GAMM|nr:hypothetical protein EDC54_103223 [Samsonia erythrinae]